MKRSSEAGSARDDDPRVVYALAQLTINDRHRYDRYASRFMDVLRRHRGALLAADEAPVVLEGHWPRDKVVLVAFDDHDQFTRWATSAEYREISADRTASTEGPVLLVHGLAEGTRI